MIFEGQLYVKNGKEPDWFVSFLSNYDKVLRFLTLFQASRFNMGVDVNMRTGTVLVQHGIETKVAHGLKNQPKTAIVTGRIEAQYIRSLDANFFYITCKLLTTRTTGREDGVPANAVEVEDSTLFRINDTVLIGGYKYQVVNISGNILVLATNPKRGIVAPVVLFQDEAKFTAF